MNLPSIDMTATGQNIRRLRRQAGLSVKDLQDIFGFATPQAIYKLSSLCLRVREAYGTTLLMLCAIHCTAGSNPAANAKESVIYYDRLFIIDSDHCLLISRIPHLQNPENHLQLPPYCQRTQTLYLF